MTNHTWGAIFDWDGVVVDSSRHHLRSWELLAAEAHLPLPPDHFQRSFGMRNAQIIPDLLHWTHDPADIQRLSERKEELYRELMAREGIQPLPGVREFLAALQAGGVQAMIATSTTRRNIEVTLELMHLDGCFAGAVTAEDVTRGKPAPDVFLQAAARLGRAPATCLVFEDALVGIAAAHAARMRVVAVATTNPAAALHEADRVVARLDELDVPAIGRWLCAPRRPA